MRRGLVIAAAVILWMPAARAQGAPPPQAQPGQLTQPQTPRPTEAEQEELMHAVQEGANSTLDLVRVFEAFLLKHPDTMYRPDIELNLTRASIENKDDARVVLYGEKVLEHSPDDVVTLDKVAQSLVALGRKRERAKGAEVRAGFREHHRRDGAAGGPGSAADSRGA